MLKHFGAQAQEKSVTGRVIIPKGWLRHDYFGARYYDARIGRWGGVEPKMEKYYSYSPYIYSLNNTFTIIDIDGKDPVREQFGSLNDVMNVLNNSIGKSLFDIGKIFGSIEGNHTRYVYTQERGILDLQHVFAAANVSAELGFDLAIFAGETWEDLQSKGIFDKESAWSPEDLSSNLQGAVLGQLLSGKLLTKSDVNAIIEFLKALKVINPDDPSIAPDKVYIPTQADLDAGKTLPRRYSYAPYYGENPYFKSNF